MPTIAVGSRVKLSALAFRNGAYHRNERTLAKRGTIMRETRADPDLVVVKWDDTEQEDRLHRSFLSGAQTTMIIKVTDRNEASLIRRGLKNASVRALVKVMGALQSMPYRSDRVRAMRLAQDHFAQAETKKE